MQDILRDAELTGVAVAYVMAAPDPVGCSGATDMTRTEFGLDVTVITGPATDNEVGRDYVLKSLHLPAHNALRDAEGLVGVVRKALAARVSAPQLVSA